MRRAIAAALLAGYLIFVFYLTLFAFPHTGGGLNLTPFATIADDLRHGGHGLVVNFLGNLGVFIPLGLLVPYLRPGWASAGRVALLGAGISLLIEWLQYASGRRVADVDDVILDTLGAVLGYLIFMRWRRPPSRGRGVD